jgi:endonuclease/exonuclease/phosphatase family metal-dependent hydrolase
MPSPRRARLRRFALALGALLGGPAALAGRDPAPPLGAHPKDQALLAGSRELAHLALALRPPGAALGGLIGVDPDGPKVVDLLAGPPPAFFSAPEPALLAAGRPRLGEARAAVAPGAAPLRALSYNTGLLDRKYIAGHVKVPHRDSRRLVLPERLLNDGWDVILLQEVWEWEDVALLAQAAEAAGYRWWAGEERRHVQHGVMILVRAALVSGPEQRTEGQFEVQRRIERWPGPNVRRGWLSWTFTHAPSGRRLRVASAHPQAWPQFWRERSLQARQLALAVNDAPEDVIVLLGVDLNAAPYYPHDRFGEVKGKPVEQWWRNAITYPLLRHYGDLLDVAALAAPAGDVAAMAALPAWSPSWASQALGGACGAVPTGVFSATDCNSLYFASYAGEEYPARLDYLFLRDHSAAVGVHATGQAYVDPMTLPTGNHELSDHYGVWADLSIAPLAPAGG